MLKAKPQSTGRLLWLWNPQGKHCDAWSIFEHMAELCFYRITNVLTVHTVAGKPDLFCVLSITTCGRRVMNKGQNKGQSSLFRCFFYSNLDPTVKASIHDVFDHIKRQNIHLHNGKLWVEKSAFSLLVINQNSHFFLLCLQILRR